MGKEEGVQNIMAAKYQTPSPDILRVGIQNKRYVT
jgi:hypothetical protein